MLTSIEVYAACVMRGFQGCSGCCWINRYAVIVVALIYLTHAGGKMSDLRRVT